MPAHGYIKAYLSALGYICMASFSMFNKIVRKIFKIKSETIKMKNWKQYNIHNVDPIKLTFKQHQVLMGWLF